jgi:uncharacterized protein
MIFNVRVSVRASRNRVEQVRDTLKVYVTKPASDGLANAQLVDLLSNHFKVKRYQVRIKSGLKSRAKLVEIDAAI